MVSHRLMFMAVLGVLHWSYGEMLSDSLVVTRKRALTTSNSSSEILVQAILTFQIARQGTMDNATVIAFERGTKDFFQSNLLYFHINSTGVQSQLSQCNAVGSTQQSSCSDSVYLLIAGSASAPLRTNADMIFGRLLVQIVALNLGGLLTALSQQSTSIGTISSVDVFSNSSLSPTPSPSSMSPTTKSLQSPAPSTASSNIPSDSPSLRPSPRQSESPSASPSQYPSQHPSSSPSLAPSLSPSFIPSQEPSIVPSLNPSLSKSPTPSQAPSSHNSLHTADITIQLQRVTQAIPSNDKHAFEVVTSNFISQYFPNIQGFLVEILSVTITSQVLSNRRLYVLREDTAVASTLLVGMNVAGSVTANSGSLAISDEAFQNLVSQIFQSHFDVYTARLTASSSIFDNLTYTAPSSPKGASTFVIALSVSVGALGALALAAVAYWWNARRRKPLRSSSGDGIPKEVNAIHTSSTKELEFDTGSRAQSIPKFLKEVHSMGPSARHRADISVMSDNFDMSIVSENYVSHWSCIVSSDCEKSAGSDHDADSDEYGDDETEADGTKLMLVMDQSEATPESYETDADGSKLILVMDQSEATPESYSDDKLPE